MKELINIKKLNNTNINWLAPYNGFGGPAGEGLVYISKNSLRVVLRYYVGPELVALVLLVPINGMRYLPHTCSKNRAYQRESSNLLKLSHNLKRM